MPSFLRFGISFGLSRFHHHAGARLYSIGPPRAAWSSGCIDNAHRAELIGAASRARASTKRSRKGGNSDAYLPSVLPKTYQRRPPKFPHALPLEELRRPGRQRLDAPQRRRCARVAEGPWPVYLGDAIGASGGLSYRGNLPT